MNPNFNPRGTEVQKSKAINSQESVASMLRQSRDALPARLSALAMDISEFIEGEDLSALDPLPATERPIAFQAPCSLQHGLQRAGRVESLLTGLGFKLTPVADAHLCCGSAGSYAVLQRELSERLLANKIRNLEAGDPALIATANEPDPVTTARRQQVPPVSSSE